MFTILLTSESRYTGEIEYSISLLPSIINRKIEVRTYRVLSATKKFKMHHPGIPNYNILYFLLLE